MHINWLTVAAQIVNFLVLVWLLHRFLYGPVVRAMDTREQRIADRMREAEEKNGEAENQARLYRKKQEELDEQRDDLLAEAREAAEAERKSLERQAREDVDARRHEWLKQLKAEQDTFLEELQRHSTEQFYALINRALVDLANADLEEQIALSFIKQLEGLGTEVRKKMARAHARKSDTVTIRSHFELRASVKGQLTKALHELFGDDTPVQYETVEGIDCGMELIAGAQTVAWTFSSYLESYQKAVNDQMSNALSKNGN